MSGLLYALLRGSVPKTVSRVNKTPTEYALKAYSRVLKEVEDLARENGGRPPVNYSEEIAARTGYTPDSVSGLLKEIRAGNFGPQLQARAHAIPHAPNTDSSHRKRVAELMDEGLGPQEILERMQSLKPETTYGSTRALMSQVRRKRRETGDPSAYAIPLGLLGLMSMQQQEAA